MLVIRERERERESLRMFKIMKGYERFLSTLLFKGPPLFRFIIFQFKNAPTLLCLSRDKTKGQFNKNETLIPTKTLSKKQDHFPINFQIDLFTYKLNFQNKNYIYCRGKGPGTYIAPWALSKDINRSKDKQINDERPPNQIP